MIERLDPNWAQIEFLDEYVRQRRAGQPVRIIALKARQLGFSTITEAAMFWNALMHDHSFGLVMAHLTDSTEAIFDMTRRYWDYFPYRDAYTQKYHSKRELSWEEPLGSGIRIATASSKAGGRARTINFLHGSEVAFWDEPEELMTGLRQTVPSDPSSVIILESTANGVGNWFHHTWVEATDEANEYTPMFFPWWRHPEYTASHAGLTMPPIGRLDEDEQFLITKLGVDEDHLQWRRWAIPNLLAGDIEKFHQEYPATPDEAFITTGAPVFDHASLKKCYEPMTGARGMIVPDNYGRMQFVKNPIGPLTIFRLPSNDRDWGQYFVGGDPAHAGGQDYACAQVMNRRMYEQVAVWHGRIDPIGFGDELVKIAKFYNDAEISSEVEGPGYATISRLISLEWPYLWRNKFADRLPGKPAVNFGWSTNWKRKDWMISELAKLILDHSLLIHDKRTYAELREYVTLPGPAGGYGPADTAGHDDTVTSLAITIVCSRTEGPVSPYESRDLQDSKEPLPQWATWLEQGRELHDGGI